MNSQGMTLVEVLAALILISILIISFLALFTTTAQQQNASKEVMEGTYVAQVYMEKLAYLSKTKSYEDTLTKIGEENNLSESLLGNQSASFHLFEDNHKVVIELFKPTEEQTSRLIVRVFDVQQPEKIEAQMETIIWWRTNS